MHFYTVSNLDVKMTYISNELKSDKKWMDDIFVQTKFFADFQLKKFSLLSSSEDARQDAYLGLWEAIITFDYHKNFDFYRWAQWNILKKIRDNRKRTKRFNVAKSSIKERIGNCNSVTDDACNERFALEMSYLLKELFISNNSKLSKIQLDVINKSFISGKNLREIAQDHNLSIERIRQIRSSALEKVRKEVF